MAVYGYGESTLHRIPLWLWIAGGFGKRGRSMNWRRPLDKTSTDDAWLEQLEFEEELAEIDAMPD